MSVDVRKWPIRSQAAKLLGVSPRTVHRMAVRGELEVREDPEGTKRYSPDDIEVLAEESTAEQQTEDPGKLSAQALRASVSHVERLVNVIVNPRECILRLAQEEITALRGRVASLEQERTAWLSKYDELQTAAFEREMLRQDFERRQARLDRGLQEVATHAPKLIGQFVLNRRVGELLRGLSPEQMTVLEESGFLAAEQVRLMREIRGDGPSNDTELEPGVPESDTTSEEARAPKSASPDAPVPAETGAA